MGELIRRFLRSLFGCMERGLNDDPVANPAPAIPAPVSMTFNIDIRNDSPQAPEGLSALSPAPREDVASSEQEGFQNAVFVDRVLFLSGSPLKRSPAIRRREHTDSPLRESQLAVPRQELDEPTYFEIMKDSPRAAARTTRVSSL